MSVPVLVAIPGDGEAALVSGWQACRRDVVVARRCADLADLLAAAGAGLGRAALVGADLPGFDAEAAVQLRACGVVVVGLLAPDDEATERRWRQMGVEHIADLGADPVAVAAAVVGALEPSRGPVVPRRAALAVSREDPPWPAAVPPADPGTPPDPARAGRLLTVWGPAGSTGRTTVAVNVAAELARQGSRVLLVDADTYGASVAQVLGLLDEAPGLLAAVRAAGDGRWDVPALHRTASEVSPGLRVLTGAADPARWHELRPGGLSRVLQVARAAVDWTVVDVAACADQDEESTFDVPVLRRNAATLTALDAADVALVVGAGDPVGLQRLVRAWHTFAEAQWSATPLAVVNRLRASAVGPAPARRVTAALHRFAGIDDPALLPEDVPTCDAALLQGRTLAESAPRSPLRLALGRLAERARQEAVLGSAR